jgi:CHAT domain-containing protein
LPDAIIDQARTNNYDHAIIVNDPALQRLPFQALPVGFEARREHRLDPSETHVIDLLPPICYSPSIQILDLLRVRGEAQILGNRVVTLGGHDEKLPESRQECLSVANRFQPLVVKLIGPRATEGLLRMYASQCRMLHIAGHAEYVANTHNLSGGLPLRTREFARASMHQSNNGMLTLYEVFGLDLRGCEVVILSACSTKRAESSCMDNGQSLARAFIVAGASRAIATFWDVPDAVPKPIMDRFFTEIARQSQQQAPIDYAVALHNAMRNTRNDRERTPYHWACFALVGPPVAAQRWDSL